MALFMTRIEVSYMAVSTGIQVHIYCGHIVLHQSDESWHSLQELATLLSRVKF